MNERRVPEKDAAQKSPPLFDADSITFQIVDDLRRCATALEQLAKLGLQAVAHLRSERVGR